MERSLFAILPFEPAHYAALAVRSEQAGDPERLGAGVLAAADMGPAFTAAETDLDGRVKTVLGCAGLVEQAPGHAVAWACFAEGLRPAQWSALTGCIRRVIAEGGYHRIDIVVRKDFEAAHRYARHLGFEQDLVVYTRTVAPLLEASRADTRAGAREGTA